MTRLTFIPAQFIKVATAHRPDLAQYVVAGIHIAPGSSTGVARAWKVNLPSFTNGGEIPIPNNAAAKDDSVFVHILNDGSLLVTIDEALPFQGGATAQPDGQLIAGVFPAASAGVGGVDAVARADLARVRTHLRNTP